MTVESPLLTIRDLSGGYGVSTVLRHVNLDLVSGRVLALLGPNGAGKTTLMLTLAGLLPRRRGDVRLSGASLPSGNAAFANRAGVVLVPDDRALFTALTVRENITIASKSGGSDLEKVLDLFPALRKRLDVKAGAISGGEQQMLAMARGLVRNPKVLLVDEMSMGLAPLVVEALLPIVRSVADDTGAAVVIVEQHVGLALEVADDVQVLVRGELVAGGTAEHMRADPTVLETAYLGHLPEPDHTATAPSSRSSGR